MENIGNETLHFLEIFNSGELKDRNILSYRSDEALPPGRVQDISLSQVSIHVFSSSSHLLIPDFSQWLALTPPDLVKAHLDLDDATIAKLSKTKPVVVGSS